ncbi:MAG: bile acid:sodium symporter family protein [Alphaproteobacteria bacterium]|nr:bile acid:sodium symporter family protein [Alphaproteobacteria bacterium]
MEESALTSIVLPLALFIIMLGMGLSLSLADFRRVLAYPRAATVGLLNQLVLLPIVGFALASAFDLPPAMAAGVVLIAACPGGVTSNLITHVSRGDTALSISLTAISSFITVFSIPLIVGLGLQHFMGSEQAVALPVLKTVAQIVGITVLPVSVGMGVRARWAGFADRMERPVRIASVFIFTLITVGVIAANVENIQQHGPALIGVTTALNVGTMVLGFVAARLARLSLPQTLTISIESGIQNGTLAIVIATSIIKMGDLALPGGIYSLVMFATGGVMMALFGLAIDPREAAPAPAGP